MIVGYVRCSEYSMQLNASRIKVLQALDDLITSMKTSAGKELLNVSHNKKTYKKLIQSLIVQVPFMSFTSYLMFNNVKHVFNRNNRFVAKYKYVNAYSARFRTPHT